MNKQEKIREGIAERIHLERCGWSLNISEKEELSEDRIERWKKYWVEYSELPEEVKEQDRIWADGLLSYLHSQGVVIKVDRELPTPADPSGKTRMTDAYFCHWADREVYVKGQQDMIKAGYEAFESLIEGGHEIRKRP